MRLAVQSAQVAPFVTGSTSGGAWYKLDLFALDNGVA